MALAAGPRAGDAACVFLTVDDVSRQSHVAGADFETAANRCQENGSNVATGEACRCYRLNQLGQDAMTARLPLATLRPSVNGGDRCRQVDASCRLFRVKLPVP